MMESNLMFEINRKHNVLKEAIETWKVSSALGLIFEKDRELVIKDFEKLERLDANDDKSSPGSEAEDLE